MRMCWRGDLERWLLAQPSKRFDEGTARYYAAQIVLALKHLHCAGVVHRDISASCYSGGASCRGGGGSMGISPLRAAPTCFEPLAVP